MLALFPEDAATIRYGQKVEATRRTVSIARLRSTEARARATLDWLVPALEHRDPWWRRYAIDALRWMAEHQNWAFTPDDDGRLQQAALRLRNAALATDVRNMAMTVRETRSRLSRPQEKAPSSP